MSTQGSAGTIADRLRAAGERVTRQRLVVADALAATGRQATAQDLYERLRARAPHIGRATVFRTLEALVAAGVARRLEADGHVYAYVACRPGHHHHLACSRCGRVEEIGEAYIRPVAERVAAERGFRIDDARLDFYGICARCTAHAG
ncbi:MAG TPA: Fur family transcriptional regulator [Candidatus Limnocylindria bacterium]|nr:Fur family transcriptional regulator [Candidatus Limnocylindria bacterium]